MSESRSEASVARRRRRIRLMIALVLVFGLAGAAYGVYWYEVARYSVATDDAYVHGNRVPLSAQVQGTVTSINAEETDFVSQGEPLVELDASDYRVALDRAKAKLAQTVRDVRQLYEQASEQRSVIQQRKVSLTQARRDYRRAKRLADRNVTSRESYQQVETRWQEARANLKTAQRKLSGIRTQITGTDPEHHPRVRLAASAVRKAWLDVQRTRILAPVSGFVAKRGAQVGETASPGKPLLSIVPLDQLWVQANFKETDLQNVRIGQPVTVTADFYGHGVTYHGRVVGLSAGTGSAFELLPPQNATGNWIKVVQRVPVRISLDPAELEKHPLRLGLSLHVSIDVHDTSGKVLTRVARHEPVYRTPVFKRDTGEVDRMISQIIHRNDNGSKVTGSDAHDGE
ncbi:MAG TPA: HlyD family efflux transporter periplasmic adaptor subunit [Gammaproteobacteria bacterium]|nr:HlyD family efflux transporter periplasmic adaptor subunit [Gammaproteobacteria bacterium]